VIMPGPNPATRQLVEIFQATGIGAIAVEEVPPEQTQLYGIADATPSKDARWGDRSLQIRDLVEKPHPSEAPSNLAVTGRYVLPPQIFDYLENTKPGRGGEIQLTDALRVLAKENGLWAYLCEGKTYDAGDKLGFLKATVEIALQNESLGKAFRQYLKSLEL
jgi:UTP--glucose-1-phosphate uridylyltransferase